MDEARLNRKSFGAVLKKFARDLGRAVERTFVFVSCRVPDWKIREERVLEERVLIESVTKHCECSLVEWFFVLTATAYNLIRISTILAATGPVQVEAFTRRLTFFFAGRALVVGRSLALRSIASRLR